MLKKFLILYLLSASQWLCAESLDDILKRFALDSKHSPFVVGEKKSKSHPEYESLLNFAESLSTEVEWVSSVSDVVLALTYHPSRMRIRRGQEFDGWFDEYTEPNLILLHQGAALIIFIHELRHALQLGRHGKITGNWFDQQLQKSKVEILRFHRRLRSKKLDASIRIKLERLSTRLIEACSEISAHQGDLMLSLAFHKPQSKIYRRYIDEYYQEFKRAAKQLKMSKDGKEESFIDELSISLEKFMQEHNLEK